MSAKRFFSPDILMTLFFGVVFAYAIFEAQRWPFRTQLFPMVTSVIILALIVLKLVLDVRKIRGEGRSAAVVIPAAAPRPTSAVAPVTVPAGATAEPTATSTAGPAVAGPPVVADAELVDDELLDEAELQTIFETAPRGVWLQALGWIAAFFVSLWVFGAFITVPAFTFLYIWLASKDAPWWAAVYAGVTFAFLYGLFDRVLHIPLPTGELFRLLGQ